MTKRMKSLLTALAMLTIATHASADITLKERLASKEFTEIDLGASTQSLSGEVIVDGVKYISNGALRIIDTTNVILRDGAGLVFVNYDRNGRKAGQLIATPQLSSKTITFAAENANMAKGIIFLGRDAPLSQNNMLCSKGFASECEKHSEYFNYGSLDPTNYNSDSCAIINSVTFSGLGEKDSDASALIFAGCGSGTFIADSTITDSGGDGISLIDGDTMIFRGNVTNSETYGMSWSQDYQGWMIRHRVLNSKFANYEGNNSFTALGPVICSNIRVSIDPVSGVDLTLNSGNVFVSTLGLFNTVNGDASNNVFLVSDLPFSTGC